MAPKNDRLRKAYEFKIGKDRTSKLTDQQINLLSKYYNSLSQNEQQDIDSALFQGRTCELTDMADAFISETKGTVGGGVSVYKPEDKWVDDKKEFAKEQERKLDDALSETSDAIMDAVDALIAADKKRFEDFKKQQQKDATVKRRTADILKKLENSTKKREQYATPIGPQPKLKRNPEFGYNQYETPVGPLPMQGPMECKKGLIGTRKVLTLRQVEEKYGLSPQAPFPEWTKKVVKNASVDDDDWEDETNDLLAGKLDDILKQVREEPLPEQPKKKKRTKKTPLGSTKRYDFDPEELDNKKKLNLILENVIETRKALFELYKINKKRFEFKKTVDKRLTNELEAKQREKEVEKGPKKEQETLIIRVGKKLKTTLWESILAGFTAGAVGLVTQWEGFVGNLKENVPWLFPKEEQEKRKFADLRGGDDVVDGYGNLKDPIVKPGEFVPPDQIPLSTFERGTTGEDETMFYPDGSKIPASRAYEFPDGTVIKPGDWVGGDPNDQGNPNGQGSPNGQGGPNAPIKENIPISKIMNDKYKLNMISLIAISALEAGDAQSRADVAQSILNRYSDLPNENNFAYYDYLNSRGKKNNLDYYGDPDRDLGITNIILNDAQYQPAYVDPTVSSGPGTATAPEWLNLLSDPDKYNAAIDAMMSYFRKRYGYKDPRATDRGMVEKLFLDTEQAITNPTLMSNSRRTVGRNTEFNATIGGVPVKDRAESVSRGRAGIDNVFYGGFGSNRDEGPGLSGPARFPTEMLYKELKKEEKKKEVPKPVKRMNLLDRLMQMLTGGGQQKQQQSSNRIDTSNIANRKTIGVEPPQQPLS